MARQMGFVAALARLERETARHAVAAQRHVDVALRESERARRAEERAEAAGQREAQRAYFSARVAECNARQEELGATNDALENLLRASLDVDHAIDFELLKEPRQKLPWPVGPEDTPLIAPKLEDFLPADRVGVRAALGIGSSRHAARIRAAHVQFNESYAFYAYNEPRRQAHLKAKRAWHEQQQRQRDASTAAQHLAIDSFRCALEGQAPEAVTDYFELVLRGSRYPVGFAKQFRLAYVPTSRQLIVEYSLPSFDIVPPEKIFRYVKATDSIVSTPRPAAAARALYAEVIAQLTLRTIHEVFEADRAHAVDIVVFNGVLHTRDPGTGRAISPCLVTVRTTRDSFGELDLAFVTPFACLKTLSANVSKSPAELLPVRPVLEFDMVDPRFVAESDALVGLDERPNLMELTPTDFEVLIQNLFARMGLDAKQTRPSRDGGVDCVAFDPRPIFGGKVVIQAKRYKNTVGVSAVRDLYGTLQNEGASKGILVTTSGYGQASFEFAANKPIELLDGSNLLYLLEEHMGLTARIVPPDNWSDPLFDQGI